MLKTKYRIYLTLLLCLLTQPLWAQGQAKQIEITHADRFIGETINGVEVRKLIGNVGFRQGDVVMNCDSAYFYQERNSVNAWGHIHINHADTVNLFGDRLEYDGNKKYAVVYNNVQMRDKQMTLTTDRLDYDVAQKRAFYLNGGTITDSDNKLTSKHGYYVARSRDLFFRNDVVLVNPQYTMNCDTLQYNIITKKAFFYGPTTIRSQSDMIYCESGWYNTASNTAEFGKNAYLKSDNQFLYGDSLFYDRKRSFGRAKGNIRVQDTTEHLLVQGGYAEHYELQKSTFITKHVLVTKGFTNDTIFMTSDTLRSGYDTSGKHRILKAYKHARIYNGDFQGRADSIVYSFVDSTIDLRQQPIFWFGEYQTTAQRILVFTKNNDIEHVELTKDAFIINPEDSLRYSQVKGRDMTGYFSESKLYRIDVNGNGESIYYARDEKKAYIGMNKIIASNIRISVKDNKVNRINFMKNPDATLYPVKDVSPSEARLSGFAWHGSERPTSLEDLQKRAAADDALLETTKPKPAPAPTKKPATKNTKKKKK